MKYWIWLSQLPGVGPVLQKRLLAFFQTPEKIYEADDLELLKVDGVGVIHAKTIREYRIADILPILDRIQKLEVKVVTIERENLSDVFSCQRSPIIFYYLGTLPEKRGIAIVGARRCLEEAKMAAREIAEAVTQSGQWVISGLAKGVDSYAHSASIKVGGCTMAVLANGVDICYPKEHRRLYEEILTSRGAVISAYPPGRNPHPKYFLERNAHIAAWSRDVVVVQASEKSGSLTTAQFAEEYQRGLFVVPYSIYVKEARGSNQLLEKGAKPYLHPKSLGLKVDENLGDGRSQNRHKTHADKPISPLEMKIIEYVTASKRCEILQLSQVLMIPERQLHETLIQMEMNHNITIRGNTIRCQPLRCQTP